MTDKVQQLMAELDTWFSGEDAIPIVHLGGVCGIISVRRLVTDTRDHIMGKLDSGGYVDDDTIVRVMTVSDTLSAILDGLDVLIKEYMDKIPMDNDDILALVKALAVSE